MAETEVQNEKTVKRVVGVLSAQYFAQGVDNVTGKNVRLVLTAPRGTEIEVPESEARRLEWIGAVLPEGYSPQDAFKAQDARLDAYRAERGDQEALARHAERLQEGRQDIVDVTAPQHANEGELASHISENKLNVDDTVALAGDDPERAQQVLAAETAASGGSPRQGVVDRLEKLIKG